MIWVDALGAAKVCWTRARRWVLLALAGLVGLLASSAAWRCSRDRAVEEALRRVRQEQAARAAGVPVVEQAPEKDVRKAAEQLEREAPELRAQVARLEAAVGRLETLLVVRARTEGAPVQAPPGGAKPPTSNEVEKREHPPAVALYAGQRLVLGADIELKASSAGAQAIVGQLWAEDGQGFRLTTQAFSAPVTRALGTAPAAREARSGWRWGPQGGISSSGWLAGATVATPELRLPLVGWRVGWAATVAGGPGTFIALTGPTF